MMLRGSTRGLEMLTESPALRTIVDGKSAMQTWLASVMNRSASGKAHPMERGVTAFHRLLKRVR